MNTNETTLMTIAPVSADLILWNVIKRQYRVFLVDCREDYAALQDLLTSGEWVVWEGQANG